MANGLSGSLRRIFISSTTQDLDIYRQKAQKVIESVSTSMEGRFTLTPKSLSTSMQDGERLTSLETSRSWVRNDCDWVVLIVAWYYGHVPPEQPRESAISVTQAEYLEAISSGKPCFVFLAGESTDTIKYWPRDQIIEGKNLSDWRGPRTEPNQPPEFARFKEELRKYTHTLFSDIDDFGEKLAETLRRRIDREIRGDPPLPPPPGDLLQPELQKCFDEVKLLARLKRLHDTLHRIRQFGIRSWREELAASWPEDDEPPLINQNNYNKSGRGIVKLVERVGNVAGDLPMRIQSRLLRLSKVVIFELPDVPECGKGNFTESTDAFARSVQLLFSSCNGQMGESATRLQDYHYKLSKKTAHALDQGHIATNLMAMVRDKLEHSKIIHSRVQYVLQNHRLWQEIHDALERIDSEVLLLHSSRDHELCEAVSEPLLWVMTDDIFEPELAIKLEDLLADIDKVVSIDHDIRHKRCAELVGKLRKHLTNLKLEPSAESYAGMRKYFDDLFFEVDLETLAVVESVETRVRAVEAGIQGTDKPLGIP